MTSSADNFDSCILYSYAVLSDITMIVISFNLQFKFWLCFYSYTGPHESSYQIDIFTLSIYFQFYFSAYGPCSLCDVNGPLYFPYDSLIWYLLTVVALIFASLYCNCSKFLWEFIHDFQKDKLSQLDTTQSFTVVLDFCSDFLSLQWIPL